MEVLEQYASALPTGLQTKVSQLTSIPSITSIPSTISQNYETITSIIAKAELHQRSAYSALNVVTASVSSISLINDIIQAQATLNYYNVLEQAATVTNTASHASLMTKAAQASEIMLEMFNDEAYYSGNYPSFGGNIALVVVFSIFLTFHVISGVFYHQWWFLFCWTCGLALEILGYAGRIWSSQNIMSFDAFVMQLVCLTLGPCFLMAGIYYVIAQLTLIYGQKFSVLRPMQYSFLFIIGDLISIILQAAGGGVAAGSLSQYESTEDGSHIMVAGLAFQVFTIAAFQIFWYIFFFRVYRSYKKHGDSEFNPHFTHIRERKFLVPFIFGISFAVVLIFVRSIYRLIELAEGWSSNLATKEIYFMILEALMVSLASCVLTFLTPGLAYGRNSHLYIDKSLKATFGKHYKNNKDHAMDNPEKDEDSSYNKNDITSSKNYSDDLGLDLDRNENRQYVV